MGSGSGRRGVLALLAVAVLLFAPAPDEGSGAENQGAVRGALGARSLAPAVREGNTTSGPKLDLSDARVTDTRWIGLIQGATVSAGATLPLLWGLFAAGLRSGNRQRLFGVR